jgi:phosphatidylglycerophosphatase A
MVNKIAILLLMKLPSLKSYRAFPGNIQRKEKVYLILGSLFGMGFIGIVPATLGSAGMGVILLSLSPWVTRPILFLVSLGLLFAGKVLATAVERIMNERDPRPFVLDECLGMVLSLLFVQLTLVNTIIAFLLFRFFDVVKPYPCRRMEKVPHGWGVMLDDVVAGLYAGLVLATMRTFWDA